MALSTLPSLLEMLKLDPALTQMGAELTEQEKLQQALIETLRQRATEAQGGADQARQRFQGALQTPVEGGGAGDILSRLGGGIASALSGNQRFAQRAEMDVAQGAQQRATTREQKLQLLQDEYMRRADIAQQAGQLEFATKYQAQALKVEQLQQRIKDAQQKVFMERQAKAGHEQSERESLRSAQTALEVAKINAASRSDTAKLGYNLKTGLMLRDFYVKERNKLLFLARNKDTDKDALRTGLLAHEINRLDGETPEAMADRLERLRDPYDRNRYLVVNAPVNKLMGGPRAETPEVDDAILEVLRTFFTEEELEAAKKRKQLKMIGSRAR